MDLDNHLNFEHLFLYDRKCRICGQTKNLIDEFYRIRKDRGPVASSYSYECKDCTRNRIRSSNLRTKTYQWEYPDW